jgi:hypothetical protein
VLFVDRDENGMWEGMEGKNGERASRYLCPSPTGKGGKGERVRGPVASKGGTTDC